MTIYYGLTREQQVLDMAADVVSILGGGKKKRQQQDINTAKAYWQDYKARKRRSK